MKMDRGDVGVLLKGGIGGKLREYFPNRKYEKISIWTDFFRSEISLLGFHEE
jgi:hypothetical protein